MTPGALDQSNFGRYPALGRQFAINHVNLLRRLPLAVLPSILEQVITLDWKFPRERDQLEVLLMALQKLDPEAFQKLAAPFSKIDLPAKLTAFDWVNQPAQFVQLLTPLLWSSGQIDRYRDAATQLFAPMSTASTGPAEYSRVVLFVAAGALTAPRYPLFSKLRPHGLHFTNVEPEDDSSWALDLLTRRASGHQEPYLHWYLDGGEARSVQGSSITTLSYKGLDPVRRAVVAKMDRAIRDGVGPEVLYRQMAAMQPAECGAQTVTTDPVLQHFVVDLFTLGAGTQIYSTTFVQWTAREILRRAQPETMFVRVAPRVRGQDLNSLVKGTQAETELDPAGSMVDADLAAYYTWLELRKLPGSEGSVFLAWFPGRHEALLTGPSVPTNVRSESAMKIGQILALAPAPISSPRR
ncbi:MAG: hypothetical protein ABI759_18345 [Candidatus Solibacter sp.]